MHKTVFVVSMQFPLDSNWR